VSPTQSTKLLQLQAFATQTGPGLHVAVQSAHVSPEDPHASFPVPSTHVLKLFAEQHPPLQSV
jgi:hypothetical protein